MKIRSIENLNIGHIQSKHPGNHHHVENNASKQNKVRNRFQRQKPNEFDITDFI